MKKKPLFILITDTHLNHKNIELVIDIFRQAIEQAQKLGLKVIYHAGDLFDSRKHQTLATLRAFAEILLMCEEAGIVLRAIPGNHDKPDYFSANSYLDVYERYGSLELVREWASFKEGDYYVHMIPFFDEREVYPHYLSKAAFVKGFKNILITHIAVDGVRNNDGSEIENTFDKKAFKKFEKVLVGHYHNAQEVGNVAYVGSAYQKDYGEDDDKGMTLVYDDGSLERILLDFPRFETIKIDLNVVTTEELEKTFKSHEKSEDNIRFKFSGTKEKLAALDRPKYIKAGIDVKTEQDDPEIDLDYAELVDFTGFSKAKILDEWGEFSEKHEIDENIEKAGKIRLEKTFNE